MYRLELDLELYWTPLFNEYGQGISVTRTLEIPFVPHTKVALHSTAFEGYPDPLGFTPRDITWDMDRQVFLATTKLVSADLPIHWILEDIKGWIGRGWRLGSYRDAYPSTDDDDEAQEKPSSKVLPISVGDWDDDEIDRWRTKPSRGRPKEFNRLMGVLTRVLAELYNNEPVAYAMDKTKRFFTEEETKEYHNTPATKWRNLKYEFEQLPIEKKVAWREKIIKKYPSLEGALGIVP